MATEKEEQVPLMDEDTRELFELFPTLNQGRLIDVEPYGELKEIVVLAAIGNGMKNHEIEFKWIEAKDRKRPQIKTVQAGDMRSYRGKGTSGADRRGGDETYLSRTSRPGRGPRGLCLKKYQTNEKGNSHQGV